MLPRLNRLKRKAPDAPNPSTRIEQLDLPPPPPPTKNDINGDEPRGRSPDERGQVQVTTISDTSKGAQGEQDRYSHRHRFDSEDGRRDDDMRMRVGRGETRGGEEEGGGRGGERNRSGERVGSGVRVRNDSRDGGSGRSSCELVSGKFNSNRKDEDRRERGRVERDREKERYANDRR